MTHAVTQLLGLLSLVLALGGGLLLVPLGLPGLWSAFRCRCWVR
jgi:hypothetical protein